MDVSIQTVMTDADKLPVLFISPCLMNPFLGAEEQDIVSTLELLREFEQLKVFHLCVNHTSKCLKWEGNLIRGNKRPPLAETMRFWFYRLQTLDRSMKQSFTLRNFQVCLDLIYKNSIQLVITSTSSVVLFGIASGKPNIFRSHNYEPLHSLGEVDNPLKKLLHFMLKALSVRIEMKANFVWAISPRDLSFYNRHKSKKKENKMGLLPLVHIGRVGLSEQSNIDPISGNVNPNFGFLGSNYSVTHNRKGAEFLAEVFNDVIPSNGISPKLNIYGRKSELLRINHPNVTLIGWKDNISEILDANNAFLVPFVGGAGMQSKVFEPMVMGKLMICDPRVLAGYSLEEGVHFLPAVSKSDFIRQIEWVCKNQTLSEGIAKRGQLLAMEMFNKDYLVKELERGISNTFAGKKTS